MKATRAAFSRGVNCTPSRTSSRPGRDDSRGRSVRRATCAGAASRWASPPRSEEHTSELQSRLHLVCRLLLEKKKKTKKEQMTRQCTGKDKGADISAGYCVSVQDRRGDR